MLGIMISGKLIFKFLMLPLLLIGGLGSCIEAETEAEAHDFEDWQTITVTASAYNSVEVQGQGNPRITAWGDTLSIEVQSIAVSRDLIKKGLKHNTPVRIKGFDGIFIVNDKMHPRWRNKIDIYMGKDKEKALKWGRRKVEISFPPVTPPAE